jgi:hypothetical protein
MRRLAGIAALGIILAACGGPGPRTQAERDIAAEGLATFERGDWALASGLLRAALVKQPAALRLHYALGVATSHLDLRGETIAEFQWVLANAAGTPEAQTARDWLIASGVLRGPDTASEEASAAPADREVGTSGLGGRVAWSDGEPPIKLTGMQLFLRGIPDTPTRGLEYVLRTDAEGGFQFRKIAAGPYQLTNRIAGKALWRLRVDVPPDQDVTLELGPHNSLPARDDVPRGGG